MKTEKLMRAAAVAVALCLFASAPLLVMAASDEKGAETTRHGYYRDPAVQPIAMS